MKKDNRAVIFEKNRHFLENGKGTKDWIFHDRPRDFAVAIFFENLRPLFAELQKLDCYASYPSVEDYILAEVKRLAKPAFHNWPNLESKFQTNEIVQEVLLRLVRARDNERPPQNVNELTKLLRWYIRKTLLELDRTTYGPKGWGQLKTGQIYDDEIADEKSNEEIDIIMDIDDILDRMDPIVREIVIFKYRYKMSIAEIARYLDVDPKTIRRYLNKFLDEFRKRYDS